MDTEQPHGSHKFASMFPLLEGEALAELVTDIRTHGLIEDIWLYEGQILDGRNRYHACQLADIAPRFATYAGDDPIAFSWSLNGARRHLSTGQCAMATLGMEALYAAEAKEQQAHGMTAPGRHKETLVADLPQSSTEPKKRKPLAREKAAKATGTSGRAVAQAKRVAEKAPDLAEKVAAGKMALDRADRTIRDREAEARKVAQSLADAATAGVATSVDIRHGDFREVLADMSDVDAIITDPPYPAKFLPLLGDLAAWADKVLAPDGILVILMGQTHLPEVYRRLSGFRPYRWTACYLTEGPAYASHSARLQSSWKPLLIYGGGPRFSDLVKSSGDDKAHHKWGQNYDAFHTIIERLTTQGQTVVDPFMGAGTTLLAAHALGRNVIGADIEAEHVTEARKRLSP